MGRTFIEGEGQERILSTSAVKVLDMCSRGLLIGMSSYQSSKPGGMDVQHHKSFAFFPSEELKEKYCQGELKIAGDTLDGFVLTDAQGQEVAGIPLIAIRSEEFSWILDELKAVGVITAKVEPKEEVYAES